LSWRAPSNLLFYFRWDSRVPISPWWESFDILAAPRDYECKYQDYSRLNRRWDALRHRSSNMSILDIKGGSTISVRQMEASKSGTNSPSSIPVPVAEHAPFCNFPNKLHKLLEYAHDQGSENIVSWTPDGTSFCIHNSEAFMDELAPKFFPSQSSFRSFERMVNIWGFVRPLLKEFNLFQTTSKKTRLFHHPYFLRSQPKWCQHITRQSVKGHYQRRENLVICSNIPDWAQAQQQQALKFLAKQPSSRSATTLSGTNSTPAPLHNCNSYQRTGMFQPPTPSSMISTCRNDTPLSSDMVTTTSNSTSEQPSMGHGQALDPTTTSYSIPLDSNCLGLDGFPQRLMRRSTSSLGPFLHSPPFHLLSIQEGQFEDAAEEAFPPRRQEHQPRDTTGGIDVPRNTNKQVDPIFEDAEDDESFVVY
jgi:hypothetical protein